MKQSVLFALFAAALFGAAMPFAKRLLGNIDPVRVLRNTNAAAVTDAIAECHRQAGPRYIVGAGCEVVRDTPAAHMYALRDYARSH